MTTEKFEFDGAIADVTKMMNQCFSMMSDTTMSIVFDRLTEVVWPYFAYLKNLYECRMLVYAFTY